MTGQPPPNPRSVTRFPLAPMLGLGFCSGLPLPLSSFTLQQWLVVSGVSTGVSGTVTALGLAYTLKFCWSPLFDRPPPGPFRRLGRRRGWLFPTQLALAGAIAALALTDPAKTIGGTLAAACLVAFFSASQDIAIDAWRIETYPASAQGGALAAYTWGYRAAMLAAAAGVIFLSTKAGWHVALLAAAAVPVLGAALTLFLREPASVAAPPATARGFAAYAAPLRELLARRGIGTLLGFVILFRLGKVLADGTAAALYRHGLGFSSAEVAAANFLPGLAGTFGGAAAGAWAVARLGGWRALMATGLIQSGSLLLYLALLATGRSPPMLDAKVALESFAEVAASTAFLSFISGRCAPAHTATQYAVLSSLAALVFHTVGATGGFWAEHLGFRAFYAACIAASLPALGLLLPLRYQDETSPAEQNGSRERQIAAASE